MPTQAASTDDHADHMQCTDDDVEAEQLLDNSGPPAAASSPPSLCVQGVGIPVSNTGARADSMQHAAAPTRCSPHLLSACAGNAQQSQEQQPGGSTLLGAQSAAAVEVYSSPAAATAMVPQALTAAEQVPPEQTTDAATSPCAQHAETMSMQISVTQSVPVPAPAVAVVPAEQPHPSALSGNAGQRIIPLVSSDL